MKFLSRITLFICLGISIISCKIKMHHGVVLLEDKVHELKTSSSATKKEILEEFGSPSMKSMYGVESWYYIARHQSHRAFLPPVLESQEIVQFVFDGDKLSKVNILEDTNVKISSAKEVTYTKGQNVNIFSDLINNMGKFRKKKVGR